MKKDAIHVPIVEITAAQELHPGQKIAVENVTGIVNPFLTRHVRPGKK